MFLAPWFRQREGKVRPASGRPVRQTYRPRLELLEQRFVLSGIVVQPGQSIQAAVDTAPATGAVITIEPGTYQQTVTVAKPGIQLIGLEDANGRGVVIQNPGRQPTGITVSSAGTGFVLRDVTVRNFGEN